MNVSEAAVRRRDRQIAIPIRIRILARNQHRYVTVFSVGDSTLQKANVSVPLRDASPKRHLVLLVVVSLHAALIVSMLLVHPRAYREIQNPTQYLSLLSLPQNLRRTDAAKTAFRIDIVGLSPSVAKDLLRLPTPSGINAITLPTAERTQQNINWDRESALAAQSSIDQATKEKSYRDLSNLTLDQLEWLRKNHMEPMPDFHWDRNSRGELLRHGIVKLNDYCVLVVVIPFCRFGGKIQYDGDLFKNMRDPKSPDQ